MYVQVCVRAAPLQPGSPVAKELRGGSSPFAVNWRQQPGGSSSSGGSGRVTADGCVQDPDVSVSMDAAATAADIIGFEHRKVCGALVDRHFAAANVIIVAVQATVAQWTKLDRQALNTATNTP